MNPLLLLSFATVYGVYPFPDITVAHIEEAIHAGMEAENKAVAAIVDNPDAPTFENTIEALETSGELLERATTLMYNLLSAHTNDDLEDLAQRVAPILSEHGNNIMLNARLYERVKTVYGEYKPKDAEEAMLLKNTYEAFERSGATLDEKGKQRFREISAELSKLTLQFSQNKLKDTNNYYLHITDEQELDGLPELQRGAARENAAERGWEGWVITLHAPDFVPFMAYAKSRKRREELYRLYNTLCTHGDQYDNFAVVSRIVDLRREKAQLLGYPDYAAYVLKHRMAETPENVREFLQNLTEAYLPAAREDVARVEAKAKSVEGDDFDFQPWDFAYYTNLLRREQYDFDPEQLRPYFELGSVIKGVFGLATRLYGITFEENPNIPVYHPDVKAYEVKDADGSHLAVLYTDFHPRDSKKGGAWMTNYREAEGGLHGTRPHVSLTMNFTKPQANRPALLTLDEVNTFLHEFGHALHSIFAATRYKSLSGTNVYWDFVELPSQFMENFSTEPEFLNTFAFHYQTGEPIPQALIDKIISLRTFNAAYSCMRQVSFGLLDMAFYSLRDAVPEDVRAFEKNAVEPVRLLPDCPEACMAVTFGHIMSGGYAAGYYSYKWAEVLDADAFAKFQETGIFNTATARSFRSNILSQGGTRQPMDLYVNFRGRKPTIDALLRRDGIKK